jgi:hypothetical protein
MKFQQFNRLLASLVLGLLIIVGLCGCQPKPGIDKPVQVSGDEIQLYSAFFNSNMVSMSGGKILVVSAEILSGTDDTSKWEVWLTDGNGRKSTPGVTMTGVSPNNKPNINWSFDIAKNASSLTLHLPGEQTISIDSLVK